MTQHVTQTGQTHHPALSDNSDGVKPVVRVRGKVPLARLHQTGRFTGKTRAHHHRSQAKHIGFTRVFSQWRRLPSDERAPRKHGCFSLSSSCHDTNLRSQQDTPFSLAHLGEQRERHAVTISPQDTARHVAVACSPVVGSSSQRVSRAPGSRRLGKPPSRCISPACISARVKVVVASFIQPEEVYPLLAS